MVHFEKGLPDCEGIYKAINAETAFAAKEKYRYINRESDMGVPGLREAKMRYHPITWSRSGMRPWMIWNGFFKPVSFILVRVVTFIPG